MSRKVAILTLTRFPDIFHRLADSIDQHEPFLDKKLVVTSGGAAILREGWDSIPGVEPFVFSRNVNRGLARLGPDYDVLLVNDDCVWTYPDMTQMLSALVERDPSIGLLAPVVDGGVGNPDQHVASSYAHIKESEHPVCFVCVYLPASTLAKVGPMDEDFTGYGGDDVNYNNRVLDAGLRCCITNRASIVHGFGASVPYSASFKRLMTAQQQKDSMDAMNRIAQEKHAQRVAVIVPSYPVPRFIGFEASLAALKLPPGSIKMRPPGKSTARNKNDGIREAPATITHFFLVDDDHGFEPDTVLRLLRHRKPIVCALTVTSAPPCLPVAFKDVTIENGVPSHEWFTWHDLKGQTGLIEVPAGPGSGILITRSTMMRLDPPWFVLGKYHPEEQSEDVAFWERVRDLTDPRVPIYVDLATRLSHYDTVSAMPEQDEDGRWRVRFKWPNGVSVVIDPTQGG